MNTKKEGQQTHSELCHSATSGLYIVHKELANVSQRLDDEAI
jgi:hypothetical protein